MSNPDHLQAAIDELREYERQRSIKLLERTKEPNRRLAIDALNWMVTLRMEPEERAAVYEALRKHEEQTR